MGNLQSPAAAGGDLLVSSEALIAACCCGGPVDPLGTCCLTNGTCISNNTFAQCNALGGSWFPGGSCSPNPCGIGTACPTVQAFQACPASLNISASGFSGCACACSPAQVVATLPSAMSAVVVRSTSAASYRASNPGGSVSHSGGSFGALCG